mmetsp:Transcript_38370/g.87151  ORF Transcript_38370/g.87151 Transcript_38370/m.87151 type:complete len:88 (+) Transcript_38370:835-1098(+)
MLERILARVAPKKPRICCACGVSLLSLGSSDGLVQVVAAPPALAAAFAAEHLLAAIVYQSGQMHPPGGLRWAGTSGKICICSNDNVA